MHGKPISSKTAIKYGLAGMNVAKDQKKKNSIMNRNGRLSSGVQKLFTVSKQPVRLQLASISTSAVKEKKATRAFIFLRVFIATYESFSWLSTSG